MSQNSFQLPEIPVRQNPSLASSFHDRLKTEFFKFRSQLRAGETFLSYYFSGSFSMVVKYVGYADPNMIRLHGWDGDDSSSVTVFLNVSAVSIVTKVCSKDEKTERLLIGFIGRDEPPKE